MDKALDRALVWFRRDLRADDHAALYHALRPRARSGARSSSTATSSTRCRAPTGGSSSSVDSLVGAGRATARAGQRRTASTGVAAASCATATPPTRSPALAAQLGVQAVYANHDDDPAALARDARVRGALADIGVALHTSKDHVVFERSEVLTGSGKPYSVFTPYKNAWLKKLDAVLPEAPTRWRTMPARWRRCRPSWRGRLPTLARHRLRAHQPARAEAAQRQRRRRRRCSTTSCDRIDALRRDARLPGRQGPELPERAPALRHGVDPPARARGLAAHAGRLARRRDLAVAS